MVILGIDPGYAIVGYGVVESDSVKFRPLEFGAVTTEAKTPFTERLQKIFENINAIIEKYRI